MKAGKKRGVRQEEAKKGKKEKEEEQRKVEQDFTQTLSPTLYN